MSPDQQAETSVHDLQHFESGRLTDLPLPTFQASASPNPATLIPASHPLSYSQPPYQNLSSWPLLLAPVHSFHFQLTHQHQHHHHSFYHHQLAQHSNSTPNNHFYHTPLFYRLPSADLYIQPHTCLTAFSSATCIPIRPLDFNPIICPKRKASSNKQGSIMSRPQVPSSWRCGNPSPDCFSEERAD